jgi:hypothetical protein
MGPEVNRRGDGGYALHKRNAKLRKFLALIAKHLPCQ